MKTIILLFTLLFLSSSILFCQSAGNAFQVVDDLLNCGTDTTLNITGNITIEAWVKADISQPSGRFGRIVDKYLWTDQSGYNLVLQPVGGNVFRFEFWEISGTQYYCDGITPINDEIWHHLAATYDGDTVRVYFDGNLENVLATGQVNIKPSSNNFCIGSNFDGVSWQPIYAAIDEIRLWNTARSQNQLQSTMTDTLSPAYYSTIDSGLVGYWRFDVFEDLGVNNDGVDDIRDFSFYQNHGDSEGDPVLVPSGALVSVDYDDLEIPQQYSLYQNYPNPFNPTTKIKYKIPELSFVSLKVYDVLGNEVAKLVSEEKIASSYEVHFDGTRLTSGVYFCIMQAGNFIDTKKLMLIK